MANRFTDPRPQFLDSSGRVLNGGKLYFYLTASSTPATTYSDRTLTTPNSNPVVLLSDGRPATDIFLDPAVTYKVVLTNATGSTTFWTADPVVDPAAGVTAVIQVFAGDPNGHVAGNAGSPGGSGASMVYDITAKMMYVCSVTGPPLTAVWTAIRDAITGQEDVRTADYTILAADHGRTQVANKATAITFSLTAAATLGAGFTLPIKNIGAGALTIDPAGAELIDGQSTITLGQHESALIYSNGAAWRTLGFKQAATDAEAIAKSSTQRFVTPANLAAVDVDYQVFTASGTWTKPSGVTASSRVYVEAWGAGGGGGANASGGGGGGGGYVETWFLASALGATETVTVPAGGAVNTAGGNATFGSWLTAYGGGAGQNASNGGGGGGGGETSAGASGSGGSGGAGGGPQSASGASGGSNGSFGISGGGGGGGTSGYGGASYYGGGGGGGGVAGGGGASVYGGGGGGASAGGTGGASKFGGAGGAEGVAGSAPAGAGGRNAAGARGEIRVTTFI